MEHVFKDIAIVTILSGVLAWGAVWLRQPLILAYVASGVVAGPWGFGLVEEVAFIDEASHIGVTLLLFLAGIELHPRRLVALFGQSTFVGLAGCLGLFAVGFVFGAAWLGDAGDAVLIGLATMFSSTILVLKLMPTLTLHQKHMGAVCIAILIVQDLVAVLLLVWLGSEESGAAMALLPVKGLLLIGAAMGLEQWVLRPMMAYANRFHEVLYLLALAWCLLVAITADHIGFSHEVGAFLAGVALARSVLAPFLFEGLKFFRDFFLVLFFFVLGAQLDLLIMLNVLGPALILAAVLCLIKPVLFAGLFRAVGETPSFSREAGIRLGQDSEFALIIAVAGLRSGMFEETAANLVQLTTIFTMIVSSYWVTLKYPTPHGARKELKRD